MIYEYPNADEPIRQGDVFRWLPHVTVDPASVLIPSTEGTVSAPVNWLRALSNEGITVLAKIEPKWGIVVTQDCDTTRDKYIAFFEVRPFLEVTKLSPPNNATPQWWANNITKKAREGLKWFYLPPDTQVGFTDRMAASFQIVITVRTQFLIENLHALRTGRLNAEADEHFREHVAQYFRRYPYDEWYPLSKAEFEAYRTDDTRRDASPRSWQT